MAAPRRTVDSEAEGSAETVHRAIGIELGHLGGVVNMKVSAAFLLNEARAFRRQHIQHSGKVSWKKNSSTAYAPGAIWVAISARWRVIASVLQRGMTRARAFAVLGTDRAEDIS
jgi:hypothetical protein